MVRRISTDKTTVALGPAWILATTLDLTRPALTYHKPPFGHVPGPRRRAGGGLPLPREISGALVRLHIS